MSAAPMQDRIAAQPPRLLLWTTGIVGAVLAIAAFVLWGVGGAGLLVDFVAALCS